MIDGRERQKLREEDAFFAACTLLAEEEGKALREQEASPEYQTSVRERRRCRRWIYRNWREKRIPLRRAMRLAIAAALLGAVLLGSTLAANADRLHLRDIIVDMGRALISTFQPDADKTGDRVYRWRYLPEYVPVGYTVTDDDAQGAIKSRSYRNAQGEYIDFSEYLNNELLGNIDGAEMIPADVEGESAWWAVQEEGHKISLVWGDQTVFRLTASLGEVTEEAVQERQKQLHQMAESVELVEASGASADE